MQMWFFKGLDCRVFRTFAVSLHSLEQYLHAAGFPHTSHLGFDLPFIEREDFKKKKILQFAINRRDFLAEKKFGRGFLQGKESISISCSARNRF